MFQIVNSIGKSKINFELFYQFKKNVFQLVFIYNLAMIYYTIESTLIIKFSGATGTRTK